MQPFIIKLTKAQSARLAALRDTLAATRTELARFERGLEEVADASATLNHEIEELLSRPWTDLAAAQQICIKRAQLEMVTAAVIDDRKARLQLVRLRDAADAASDEARTIIAEIVRPIGVQLEEDAVRALLPISGSMEEATASARRSAPVQAFNHWVYTTLGRESGQTKAIEAMLAGEPVWSFTPATAENED